MFYEPKHKGHQRRRLSQAWGPHTCRQYLLFGPRADGILDEMAWGVCERGGGGGKGGGLACRDKEVECCGWVKTVGGQMDRQTESAETFHWAEEKMGTVWQLTQTFIGHIGGGGVSPRSTIWCHCNGTSGQTLHDFLLNITDAHGRTSNPKLCTMNFRLKSDV